MRRWETVGSPVIVQLSNGGAAFYAGKSLKLDYAAGASARQRVSAAHHVHDSPRPTACPLFCIPTIVREAVAVIDGLLDKGEAFHKATGQPLFSHMIDLSEEPIEGKH